VSFFLQGIWEKSLKAPENANLQFRLKLSSSSISLTGFAAYPQGKKKVKRQRPQVFSIFAPYQAKAFRCSLSFHKKYICLTEYIEGQKSTSSGVPIHTSAGVLPLAMQALLFYFDRVIPSR
jgi:hypothetical protein